MDRKADLKKAGYTFCDKEENEEGDIEEDEAVEHLNIMVMR